MKISTKVKIILTCIVVSAIFVSIGVVTVLRINSSSDPSAATMLIALSAAGLVMSLLTGIMLQRIISKPMDKVSKQLKAMAAGEDIEKMSLRGFTGTFKTMAEHLNDVHTAMYRLLDDSHALAEHAINGNLTERVDVSKHQGLYRGVMEGLNQTIDAVTAPIQESAAVINELAKGNMSISVTGDYPGDYAVIKASLNGFISQLKQIIADISHVLTEMSTGSFNVHPSFAYNGSFNEVNQSIERILESLNAIMADISVSAEQVASGIRQVSDGSQTVSMGATEQAGAIEELTATVSVIAQQTRQNADDAARANELTHTAKKNAEQGNEMMSAMQQAMSEINEASASISKIIKVIDDIAFQTNILALNAAVEAARAGVHGKGFAVVAEEVRNLAAKSAQAAKQTTELIEGSVTKTAAGTKIADNTASALVGILDSVDKAAELVGNIATASNEQATAIVQVNKGIEQMSQVVQNNSATSQEQAAASQELSAQAEMLKSMVSQFHLASIGAAKTQALPSASAPAPNDAQIRLEENDFGKY